MPLLFLIELLKEKNRSNCFYPVTIILLSSYAKTLIMIIEWLCTLHASHAAEEWRGALRGLATVGPPAEMRGEVRAKEKRVWRRLTNRLCAGNGTNHGYCLGLCCSLFLWKFFLHLSLIYFSLPNHSLSKSYPSFFHCCLPHETCN